MRRTKMAHQKIFNTEKSQERRNRGTNREHTENNTKMATINLTGSTNRVNMIDLKTSIKIQQCCQ